MRRAGVVLAAALLAAAAGGVWGRSGSQQECEGQRQCHDCIQTLGCAWCSNPEAEENHCQHVASRNITGFCSATDLQNPMNKMDVVQDDELTVKQHDDIIQLKPQRVKLYLRKDTPQNINITYRQARDYPLDLYYLMDLSYSMERYQQHLASVGNTLAQTMTNLTSQFTLGFGSFVDKVMLPYTKVKETRPPYSFKNDMKLSRNHTQFTERVEKAQLSTNRDDPEGGFDALMQVMVCKDKIGWRDQARHILVFTTDAKFHLAGDGRLAGIVTPNDETCHLNNQGEYTDFKEYDYPSVGQLNKVAKDNDINIMFAVLNHSRLYSELSQYIERSSFNLLQDSSANVVELIKKQYNSITGAVSLNDNSTTDIDIKYRSACKGNVMMDTNKCDGIQENDTITFEVNITAIKCPMDGKNSIVEVKAGQDTVILDIEFLCSCDCNGSSNPSSLQCQNGGSPVCGSCECLAGFYGENCQCTTVDDDEGTSDDQTAKCKVNEQDTKVCSGQGDCKCGECVCNKGVTGKFCECDPNKCNGPKGECSGHGHCECNKCQCDNGYDGPFCKCEKWKCIQDGKVCSGHGTCDCGRCICDQQGNVKYTGRYCNDCPSCGAGKCDMIEDCVQCVIFGIGPLKHNCSTCDEPEVIPNLEEMAPNGFRRCTFKDEEGCKVDFIYRYLEAENRDQVFVKKERECPEAPNIMGIMFGVIAAIIAIGVLTLILWKVFTTIHDRREYAKFENERKNTQFGNEVNPLYVQATTTTENPTFGSQQAM